jgi:hypothetical protein
MDEISPEDDVLNLNAELDEFELETPVVSVREVMVDLSGINLLIPDIIIENNPQLKESMYEHGDDDDDADENYGEDNLDDNNYAGDNESDYDKNNKEVDKNNKEEPTRRKMPTADDLSSGSDTMSEDECNELIKKIHRSINW